MRSIEWWHYEWPWYTPNPVFKVTAYLKSNSSTGTKLLQNTNRKAYHSIEWYHFQWLWLTLDRDFDVAIFDDIKYFRNDTRLNHSYYRSSIGSHRLSIEQWHFQWPARTLNAVFKVTASLKSSISKTVCLTERVTITHCQETIFNRLNSLVTLTNL